MTESDNQNTVSKWPWDWVKEPIPKPAIVKIITENFPSYARDTYDYHFGINISGLPKEYLLYNGFLRYYKVAKDYIGQQFYKIPISLQAEGRKNCNDLLDLIDRLKDAASPPPYDENPDEIPLTPDCYASEWDTLIKKLNMLVGSVQQKVEQAEEVIQAPVNGEAKPKKKHGKGKLNEKVGNIIRLEPKLSAPDIVAKIKKSGECTSDASVRQTPAWKNRKKTRKK
jgi:hypothetical protein